MNKSIILVYRDERFSPNSVERDRAILDAVGDELRQAGMQVSCFSEADLRPHLSADAFLSMGRKESTLMLLQQKEAEGALVLNSPRGIAGNTRAALDDMLRQHNLPAAPLVDVGELTENSGKSFWLKCDGGSESGMPCVAFARNADELRRMIAACRQSAGCQAVVTEHVEGKLVKFYGVQGTDFFSYYFPDAPETRIGRCQEGSDDPSQGGFDEDQLRRDADLLSRLMDVKIYGGDCIVRRDGSYAIIDFNDWPSFSVCRQAAARAIAKLVLNDKRIATI
ncbi:MAG: hypothetical protein IJ562_05915 [Prevotella sp.]|nr:hypothetical protein [Prevotella sp.]